jgi:hypothetical protein
MYCLVFSFFKTLLLGFILFVLLWIYQILGGFIWVLNNRHTPVCCVCCRPGDPCLRTYVLIFWLCICIPHDGPWKGPYYVALLKAIKSSCA